MQDQSNYIKTEYKAPKAFKNAHNMLGVQFSQASSDKEAEYRPKNKRVQSKSVQINSDDGIYGNSNI